MPPTFKLPIQMPIERHPSGELYTLEAASETSEEDLSQIARICSEELVYETLFKERLKGKQYTPSDAQNFTHWVHEGWKNNTHFVFFVRDNKRTIQAAVDIKSDNIKDAEIGYWASSATPGLMTNAVRALCDIAREAGYRGLHGLTVLTNYKSQRVLERAGFQNKGQKEEKGKQYIVYALNL